MADTWDDLIDEWNQEEFFDWIEEQVVPQEDHDA